jgi:hypothetical protein
LIFNGSPHIISLAFPHSGRIHLQIIIVFIDAILIVIVVIIIVVVIV